MTPPRLECTTAIPEKHKVWPTGIQGSQRKRRHEQGLDQTSSKVTKGGRFAIREHAAYKIIVLF
jgi:hypothetical protein